MRSCLLFSTGGSLGNGVKVLVRLLFLIATFSLTFVLLVLLNLRMTPTKYSAQFQPDDFTQAHHRYSTHAAAKRLVMVTALPPKTTTVAKKTTLHSQNSNSSSSLLNLRNFSYTLTTDVCRPKNETLFLLLLFHTAPDHFKNREIIRKLWGNLTLNFGTRYVVRCVFLLGAVKEQILQSKLQNESRLHRDMLQGNFLDTYRNLTYKNIMGFRWAGLNCGHAHFIIKSDDDTFIDIVHFAQFLDRSYPLLNGNPVDRTRRKILCYVYHGMPVLRNPNTKWYVSESEFKGKVFPDYCAGAAYALTPSVALKLANSASKSRFLWVDDAYVTGIVANRAGVGYDSLNNCVFTIDGGALKKWLDEPGGNATCRYLLAHVWDLSLLEVAHRLAQSCRRVHCGCPFRDVKMCSDETRTPKKGP